MILESAYLDDLKIWDCGEPAYPIGLTAENLGSGPEPRVSSEGKPSADGSVNRTRYWGHRMVELVGYITAATKEARNGYLDDLHAAFTLREPHVLRFTPAGETERELGVVVASRLDAPIDGSPPVISWAITLEAPDPRAYAAAWIEVSYEPGQSSTPSHGLTFPLTFPLAFSTMGGGGGTNVLNAYNGGSAPTPVLLTLDGPASGVTAIRNETTGEEVAFALIGLALGDVLAVDTGARTVTLNGSPAPWLIDASSNSWFELMPGENVLTVIGSGFVDNQTRLTARYREARF